MGLSPPAPRWVQKLSGARLWEGSREGRRQVSEK